MRSLVNNGTEHEDMISGLVLSRDFLVLRPRGASSQAHLRAVNERTVAQSLKKASNYDGPIIIQI